MDIHGHALLINHLFATRAGLYVFRPANDQWNAMTAFPDITLVSTIRTAWHVSRLHKLLPAGVMRVAVVASEDDDLSMGFKCFSRSRAPIGALEIF